MATEKLLPEYLSVLDIAGFQQRAVLEGIDIDERDPLGNTALHEAVSKGLLNIAKFLLQKGANVNAQNKTGATPLYKLATSEICSKLEYDSVDFVLDFIHLLLDKGADASIPSQSRKYPFQLFSINVLRNACMEKLTSQLVWIPESIVSVLLGSRWSRMSEFAVAHEVYVETSELKKRQITLEENESNGDRNFNAIFAKDAKGAIVFEVPFIVKGMEEKVQTAVNDIREIILQNCKIHPKDKISTTVAFPRKHIRVLIGAGGKNIKRLQDTYECRITIADDKDEISVSGGDKIYDCIGEIMKIPKTQEDFEKKQKRFQQQKKEFQKKAELRKERDARAREREKQRQEIEEKEKKEKEEKETETETEKKVDEEKEKEKPKTFEEEFPFLELEPKKTSQPITQKQQIVTNDPKKPKGKPKQKVIPIVVKFKPEPRMRSQRQMRDDFPNHSPNGNANATESVSVNGGTEEKQISSSTDNQTQQKLKEEKPKTITSTTVVQTQKEPIEEVVLTPLQLLRSQIQVSDKKKGNGKQNQASKQTGFTIQFAPSATSLTDKKATELEQGKVKQGKKDTKSANESASQQSKKAKNKNKNQTAQIEEDERTRLQREYEETKKKLEELQKQLGK